MTREEALYLTTAMREAEEPDEVLYASLLGPLIGVYYPLPFAEEDANRAALNSSKLKGLWCSIYTRAEVQRDGGVLLPARMRRALDYSTFAVETALLAQRETGP